jgi:hypothetical protein
VWAGISIKTFDRKIEELNCAREYPRFYLPTLGSMTFYAVQFFSLSDSD